LKLKDVTWIITLFLLGAIAVLIIMNPQGFATSAGTIFTGFNSWGQTLSGSGYVNRQKKAKG
jgi:hypothetical protein